ncbi:MAG TPA: hypothetical protein VED47_08080 [Burkholderiaceae bacterium]|nr:hypothetical protein [Burkholderiaceae bacterium]
MSEDERSDATVRAVREAHGLLDERPSAGVRARILQAAASQRSVSGASAPARGMLAFGRWLRAPWFASAAAIAAATVLVLAIGLGLEQPQRTVEPLVARLEASRDAGALSAPRSSLLSESGAGGAGAPAAGSSQSEAAAPQAARSGSALRPPGAKVQADEGARPSGVEPSVALLQDAASADRGFARTQGAAGAVEEADGASSGQASDAASSLSQRSAQGAQRAQANALIALGAPGEQSAPLFRKNAQTWLGHIRELRKSGQKDQADRELKLFLQAHPDVVLPEDLRRP